MFRFLTDNEGVFTAKRLGIAFAILVVGFIIVVGSLVSVDAGTVQILLQGGKPIRALKPGWHIKTPFLQSTEKMDMTIQKVESIESAGTNDLQTVSATVALNYRINPAQVIAVYEDFHHDYAIRVIKPAIEESLKASTAHYSAEQLITRREEVKSDLDEVLSDRIENIQGTQYFIFVGASLTDFAFNPQFQDAVESKVEQEQRTLEAERYLEQVRFESEQTVVQAEADAAAEIALAEGVALATVIEANATGWAMERMADAKAYQIQMVNENIADNPAYIQYTWILQWDGKLPVTVFGDENIALLMEGYAPGG